MNIVLADEVAWSLTLLLSWIAGEFMHRWINIPRICVYGIIGFVFSAHQLGVLPGSGNAMILLLANIAFGLILFEAGYRINLRWFRVNYWLGISGLAEALLTSSVVYALLVAWHTDKATALLVAALVMSTSPASVIRVINEQRSSGQVTERAIHLSAFSCVLATLCFKAVVGLHVFQSSGSFMQAVYNSVVILTISSLAGYLAGVLMPVLLRRIASPAGDGTIAFALAVVFLVTMLHALKWSPIIATLTFGITARHRRVVLSQTRPNFGALGDILSVLLFTFVASTLEWQHVLAGLGLALLLILLRLITKMAGMTVFAYFSGISWRKGVLTGLAMSPISVFVILMLEQTRYLGIDLVDELKLLAAIALILEILGPLLTQHALRLAGECPATKDVHHAA